MFARKEIVTVSEPLANSIYFPSTILAYFLFRITLDFALLHTCLWSCLVVNIFTSPTRSLDFILRCIAVALSVLEP